MSPSVIWHADTLRCLLRYVLVLTLRLGVYTLFEKTRANLGKNICNLKSIHSRTRMWYANCLTHVIKLVFIKPEIE